MQLRPRLIALAAACLLAPAAWSADLLEVWRAAQSQDPAYAAARAAHTAGEIRRLQAAALWRPTIGLEASLGRATSESSLSGARFSAPGLGSSTGVGFDTSITNGASAKAGIALRQPLFSVERGAQARQLELASDAAGLEWEAARQLLILSSAERYFELALAGEQVRLLTRQEDAVEKARQEAQDRFRLGDRPVTDVHEATARASSLRAQRLAAQNLLQLQQARFTDFTGLRAPGSLPLPPATPTAAQAGDLAGWLERAARQNPQVRLADARLRQAEQEARKSAGTLSPTVELVAQIGRERLSGSGDFGAASSTGTQGAISVQMSLPLYTGGMRGARQSEAQARVDQARAGVEVARQQTAQATRAAWLELTVGRSRAAALEDSLKASQARLDATRVGLQAGDRTTLDLLNAQNDAAGAELAVLQARTQLLSQALQLAALAGELDEAQLAQANRALSVAPGGTSQALGPMVAFDAIYIPALAFTTNASQSAQAIPTAQAAAARLRSRWPDLRAGLLQTWGPNPPPAWTQALGEVDRRLTATHAAVEQARWHDAHEELEEVRIILMQARRAQGMDYFVDRLTTYHEPMEQLALAGSQLKPEQLTPAKRADLAKAYDAARALWSGIEQVGLDAASHGLNTARENQLRQGLAAERAALDALGQALRTGDAAAVLKAAGAIKPPFARVFTAFGQPEAAR